MIEPFTKKVNIFHYFQFLYSVSSFGKIDRLKVDNNVRARI